MATRLNKALIEEIIGEAISATDIPVRISHVRKMTSEITRAALLAQLPPELASLTKVHPRRWFHWQDFLYMREQDNGQNPLAVLSEAENTYQHAENIVFEPIPSIGIPGKIDLDLLKRAVAEAKAIVAQRDEIHTQLRAYLNSRRTIEAAVKDMPELAPFMPTITTSYPLVAPSNVAALLMQAGLKDQVGSKDQGKP